MPGFQRHFEGRSEDARRKGASTRVPLKIVNIKEKTVIRARTGASLEMILILSTSGQIEKDFIVYEDVAVVGGGEGQIKQKPVTVPNR